MQMGMFRPRIRTHSLESVVAAMQNGVQCTAPFPNPRFFDIFRIVYLRVFGGHLNFDAQGSSPGPRNHNRLCHCNT